MLDLYRFIQTLVSSKLPPNNALKLNIIFKYISIYVRNIKSDSRKYNYAVHLLIDYYLLN